MISTFLAINIIFTGAVVMTVSIFLVQRLIKVLKKQKAKDFLKQWYFLQFLLLFFLLGYVSVIVLLLLGMTSLLIMFTSLIFLFGALFVFLIARFTLKTIFSLHKAQRKRESAKNQIIVTKNSLLTSFARFVPIQFIKHVGKEDVTQIRAGSSVSKKMTVLFCDIRDFSVFSHVLSAHKTFNILNHCYNKLIPVIEQNGGFVDKFIGDSIMAIFEESPDQALISALQMRKIAAMIKFKYNNNAYFIRLGIGVNTGDLSLGALGTEQRLTPTVIGDSVNLASRVEALTKKYEVSVLATEYTVRSLRDPSKFRLSRLDLVQVKGIAKPVHIYEVVGFSEHTAKSVAEPLPGNKSLIL